jgi:hypothetical protein
MITLGFKDCLLGQLKPDKNLNNWWRWRLMPIVLATQEVEIRRIVVLLFAWLSK